MTLEEAIEHLGTYIEPAHTPEDHKTQAALELGIEALKFISVSRPDPHFGHIPELPGETEE